MLEPAAQDEVDEAIVQRLRNGAALIRDRSWRLTPPPQSGTVTVNAAALRTVMTAEHAQEWPHYPERCDLCQARTVVATALAEAEHDR